jgi:hypothetical protein
MPGIGFLSVGFVEKCLAVIQFRILLLLVNSIRYFNVLVQQPQERLTEEKKINTKNLKESKTNQQKTKLMLIISLHILSYVICFLKGDIISQKIFQNLHISFAAMTCLAEGLCLKGLFSAESIKLSYLPCRHTNARSVRDGVAIFFVLEGINNR